MIKFNNMMNLIIIALLVSLAKSICYEHKSLVVSGSNIVPEGTPFAWLEFQPYNFSDPLNEGYQCLTMEYHFRNVTSERYNNTIYFQFYGTNGLGRIWLDCENECSMTLGCGWAKFCIYAYEYYNETFEYEVIINQRKIEPDCVISIIIGIFVVTTFMVAISITIYQTKRMKKDIFNDKVENFYLRISKLFF